VLRPPSLYASAILSGFLLDAAWPWPFTLFAARPAGGALAIAGLVLFAAAIREMRAARTPVPGNRPTTVIVRTGPFRFSRNPIYLAFSLLHFGVALWAGSWWLITTLIVNVTFIAVMVVPREERYLEARFGSTYVGYKSSVRRWL